jgi:hypothetical protein
MSARGKSDAYAETEEVAAEAPCERFIVKEIPLIALRVHPLDHSLPC